MIGSYVVRFALNDSDASLDPVSLSCHCNPDPRWYCAWTHPNREHQAARELRIVGLETYLPLQPRQSAHVVQWALNDVGAQPCDRAPMLSGSR